MILLDEEKLEGGDKLEKEDIHNSYEIYFTVVSKTNVGGPQHSLTDAYLIILLSSFIIVIEPRENV